MSACIFNCALSGGRLDFRVNMGSVVCSPLWAIQKAPSARTRAGDHGHPHVCARRACCVFLLYKGGRVGVETQVGPERWPIEFPR